VAIRPLGAGPAGGAPWTAGGGSRVAGQGDAHRGVREPGRKLDRRLIVAAAAEIIERDGVSRLAMRGLADQINVPVMSLYRLFPSRDALLGSVAEYVIDQLHTDPGLLLNAAERWQDDLGRLAHDVRRTALSHPQLFLLTATLPPTSRWTGAAATEPSLERVVPVRADQVRLRRRGRSRRLPRLSPLPAR